MSSDIHVDRPATTWLVYCAGRPTQLTVSASHGDAERAARRMAAQWPGHVVTVFESVDSYVADRPPRPAGPAAPPGTQHF